MSTTDPSTGSTSEPLTTTSQPFSVIVMGLDSYDSYAYPGGLDQKVINPQ